MPGSPFEAATAIHKTETSGDDKRRFTGHVPDGWQQGKGSFGGVVVGLLTRAMVATTDQKKDPARRLRSLTADLCAPLLPGAVTIEVTTLRRGASMTFLEARLVQGSTLVARASCVIGSVRDGVVRPAIHSPTPIQPTWSEVPITTIGPPIGPIFTEHYEYRATGPFPFSGGNEAIAAGWVWERDHASVTRIDEAAVVALLDSWWPTSFTIESGPRPATTVGYTMQLLVDPATIPLDRPLFYQARGVASSDNFFVEMRELWLGDRVVGMNQQTFAVLA